MFCFVDYFSTEGKIWLAEVVGSIVVLYFVAVVVRGILIIHHVFSNMF